MRIYPGRLALCLAAAGAGCHPQPAGTPEPLPSPEIVAVSRMGLEVAVPAPASIVVFELTAANTLNLLTTAGAEAAGRLEIRLPDAVLAEGRGGYRPARAAGQPAEGRSCTDQGLVEHRSSGNGNALPSSCLLYHITDGRLLPNSRLVVVSLAGAVDPDRLAAAVTEFRFDAPAEQRWEERRDNRSQPVADRLAALLRRVTANPKFGFSISEPLPGAD